MRFRNTFFTWLIVLLALIAPFGVAQAQTTPDETDANSEPIYVPAVVTYQTGLVTRTVGQAVDDDPLIPLGERFSQEVEVRLLSGPENGTELLLTFVPGILGQADQNLSTGDRVLVARSDDAGVITHYIVDRLRVGTLGWMLAGFFILVGLASGWKGIRSIFGLALSVASIALVLLPAIMNGANPFITMLLGGVVISAVTMYLSHGVNRRTTVALVSTFITLLTSIGLAVGVVSWTKLFGLGSEEAFYLQVGELGAIPLRGLLLGGIIIGILGVLDDITTTQSATVDEIYKANPTVSFRELVRRGLSVGHEHIASLVNTLALAYVGASLPLLLLFTQSESPWWVILNTERVMEEVVRTLVGSSALVIAVPIATYLAAYACIRWGATSSDQSAHAHHR